MIKPVFLALALSVAVGAMATASQPLEGVSDAAITDGGLVTKLSDFGFFADGVAQLPADGVIPYRLNTPLFSDGAEKLRFVYLPPGAQAVADGEGLLALPVGAALIKTFAFTQNGRRQLVETRVLLHRADGWTALPYQWNDDQTEARLVIAGARVPITTPAGETISYRVPNKNQCKECHGLNGAVIPIGPKARNLSADWLAQQVASGQLDRMPQIPAFLPVWETREDQPAAAAARAYLDVNCAHCHQPGATASNSGLDLRWQQHDAHAIGIGKRPVAAGRGSGGHEFDIVPGRSEASILVHRMKSLEGGVAMPELGKSTLDHDGISVVERWIDGI